MKIIMQIGRNKKKINQKLDLKEWQWFKLVISLQYKWEGLLYSDACLHISEKKEEGVCLISPTSKSRAGFCLVSQFAVTPQDTDNLLAPPMSHHNRCFLLAVQETPGQTKPV